MRRVSASEIEEAVRKLVHDTFSNLDELEERYKLALQLEESELGREALTILLENVRIAKERGIPVCQDTGVAVFYVRLGQEVVIEDGSLVEAVNRGSRKPTRKPTSGSPSSRTPSTIGGIRGITRRP